MKDLTPKDHAEAVATFRHAVIGPVCARDLSRGELAEALRELARHACSPARLEADQDLLGAHARALAVCVSPWRACRAAAARSQRSRSRARPDGALRQLICDIRREHPSASARLIVRTLEADGRLEAGLIKPGTRA